MSNKYRPHAFFFYINTFQLEGQLEDIHQMNNNIYNARGKYRIVKVSYIWMLLTMLLAGVGDAVAENSWSDRGNYTISWYNSSKSSFEISTPEELAGVAVLLNEGYTSFSGKRIEITADIDLSSNYWNPIGNKSNPFRGEINGNYKTISGLRIKEQKNDKFSSYYGFLGAANYATIENISFSGAIDIYFDNYWTTQIVGSCCGYAENSKFTNITSHVKINYKRDETSSHTYDIEIGGVLGHAYSCQMSTMQYDGDMTVSIGMTTSQGYYDSHSTFKFGGIAAYGDGRSTLSYCSTLGKFDISLGSSVNSSTHLLFGGITATCNLSEILSCRTVIDKLKLYAYGKPSKCSVVVGGISSHAPANYQADLHGSVNDCYSVIRDIDIDMLYGTLYFGGITGYKPTNDLPARYKCNYSNSDSSINMLNKYSTATITDGFNGRTDFTSSDMKSQTFADEMNLYYALNGKDGIWTFDGVNYPTCFDDVRTEVEFNYKLATTIDIYSAEGFLIKSNASEEYIRNLPAGLYIIGNKKMIVR